MTRTVFFIFVSGLTGSEAGTPKQEESFRAHSCPSFSSKLCFNCWGVNFGRNSLLPYGEQPKNSQPTRLWDRALRSFPGGTFSEVTSVEHYHRTLGEERFIGLGKSNMSLHHHASCLCCDLCSDTLLGIPLPQSQPLCVTPVPPVTSV